MHTFKFFSIMLFPLFLIYGCVKEEPTSGPTSAEGYVKDLSNLNNTVPGATVYLTRYRKGDAGGMSTQNISETISDDNGWFSIKFDADPEYQYQLCAQKEYYSETGGVCASIREGQKNTGLEIKILPLSWIKFNIINESPLDYLEYLSLNGLPAIYNYNRDTIVIQEWVSGVYQISWTLRKNGVEKQHIIKNNFSPLDTTEYIITY